MNAIKKAYHLKEEPAMTTAYLGSTIKQWSISSDACKIWSMNSQHYIKEAIWCLENELQKSGLKLVGRPNTPMQQNYRPELDISLILGPKQANYLSEFNWCFTLGHRAWPNWYFCLSRAAYWASSTSPAHFHLFKTPWSIYYSIWPNLGWLGWFSGPTAWVAGIFLEMQKNLFHQMLQNPGEIACRSMHSLMQIMLEIN